MVRGDEREMEMREEEEAGHVRPARAVMMPHGPALGSAW